MERAISRRTVSEIAVAEKDLKSGVAHVASSSRLTGSSSEWERRPISYSREQRSRHYLPPVVTTAVVPGPASRQTDAP
jgi:hypothetical protein